MKLHYKWYCNKMFLYHKRVYKYYFHSFNVFQYNYLSETKDRTRWRELQKIWTNHMTRPPDAQRLSCHKLLKLAGYARLAQACVSGESGAAENYLINEKFCLQHYVCN